MLHITNTHMHCMLIIYKITHQKASLPTGDYECSQHANGFKSPWQHMIQQVLSISTTSKMVIVI